MFIEALRFEAGAQSASGLVRGLADDRIAIALRRIHDDPARPWTTLGLAKEAALSRSAFFERFHRTVGVAPIEYLASWRMALAKDLLRHQGNSIASVAERTGYSSTNTFSTAFKRRSGQTPAQFARSLDNASR